MHGAEHAALKSVKASAHVQNHASVQLLKAKLLLVSCRQVALGGLFPFAWRCDGGSASAPRTFHSDVAFWSLPRQERLCLSGKRSRGPQKEAPHCASDDELSSAFEHLPEEHRSQRCGLFLDVSPQHGSQGPQRGQPKPPRPPREPCRPREATTGSLVLRSIDQIGQDHLSICVLPERPRRVTKGSSESSPRRHGRGVGLCAKVGRASKCDWCGGSTISPPSHSCLAHPVRS